MEFLKAFLNDEQVKKTSDILLVNPNYNEAVYNLSYLRENGFTVEDDMSYIAPFYSNEHVQDEALLQLAEQKRPKYIIINLGGGTQEKLGAYLKKNLSYKPGIICTGAAIAFLTGQQAKIPTWGDKVFLGWLFRCIDNPKLIPRYFRAFKLAPIMLRYRKQQAIKREIEYSNLG